MRFWNNTKKIQGMAACALAACLLAGCLAGTEASSALPVTTPQDASHLDTVQVDALAALLPQFVGINSGRPLDEGFLRWAAQEVDPALPGKLLALLEQNGYHDDLFYFACGQSLKVLYDKYTGEAWRYGSRITILPDSGATRLAFTGDVNLADDWENMRVYHANGDDLDAMLSAPLLERMRGADILLVNNEFTFSDRGSPMPGKQYTFRATTGNVGILQGMGATLVSLANNHVYDYGDDAFMDTLETLEGAGIPYVGAGRTVEDAMQPYYFHANGLKIAYVAASRAEKYILTPEATADSPGVLRCYDDRLLLECVATAREAADLVVVYPHWGTENTWVLEDVQVELGHKLIDAGADLVVGAHPHCLQGIEYYNGKPIVYSLGNFWFNTNTVDTALLEVTVSGTGQLELRIQPCLQSGGRVELLQEETSRARIFRALESYSAGGIVIDDEGWVRAA